VNGFSFSLPADIQFKDEVIAGFENVKCVLCDRIRLLSANAIETYLRNEVSGRPVLQDRLTERPVMKKLSPIDGWYWLHLKVHEKRAFDFEKR
jgi:hypothetical protein